MVGYVLTKARKLSRPLCVDVLTQPNALSRNGTLTPRLWSSLRRKEPHKATGGRAALPTEN